MVLRVGSDVRIPFEETIDQSYVGVEFDRAVDVVAGFVFAGAEVFGVIEVAFVTG